MCHTWDAYWLSSLWGFSGCTRIRCPGFWRAMLSECKQKLIWFSATKAENQQLDTVTQPESYWGLWRRDKLTVIRVRKCRLVRLTTGPLNMRGRLMKATQGKWIRQKCWRGGWRWANSPAKSIKDRAKIIYAKPSLILGKWKEKLS